MRSAIILVINSFCCLIGGGLVAAGLTQTSLPLQLGLAGGGLLLAVAGAAWSLFKFTRAGKALTGFDPTRPQATGIAEFDELLAALCGSQQAMAESSSADSAELAELKHLLEAVDRRKGGFDRDGKPLRAADRLRGILRGYGREIDASVRRASSCGRELKRAVEEIVSGSESQSDLMAKTANVVEQLSAHIISVCDNAESSLRASQDARENAENGLAQFRELAEDMKRIRNHVAARERKLQTLGQHTKDIEGIVATIGSLSSRTDLLALNASIESVRAGEHGRGFAVVAEEVRALAEQSAQAVVDITSRIEMIQRETHQSISGASGEHDQMHQVIQRVTDTLQSLEELCEAADRSAQGLGGISNHATQQLQLAQKVIEALEESTDCTQQNRSRAEGAHWTAKTLDEAGTQMGQALDLFRFAGALPEVGDEALAAGQPVTS